jgi:adenosylcobinamide-GDP ribazoletransferase
MNGFSLAWQFLTILPWRKGESRAEFLGQSLAFYPTIGLLLGLILWGVFGALAFVFPPSLCAGLIVLLAVVLTGALHLDGLADTLDGLAFGRTSEERLQIMRDHRVGTFGVVGLILILGMKFLALNSVPPTGAGKGLLAALVLGRWSMVQLLYRAPYARAEGLGRAFKDTLRRREVVVAGITSLIFVLACFPAWGGFLWLCSGLFTLGVQAFFEKRLGGITGDVLGACNEANEVLALILISGIMNA